MCSSKEVVASSNPDIGNRSASPYSYIYGNGYWPTSSIREWLNSDNSPGNVIYTNEPPNQSKLGSNAYDQEAGFLHGFTQKERDGIAVTERRNFIHTNMGAKARDGGSGYPARYDGLVPSDNIHISSTDIDKNWKNYSYQAMKEKVFILGLNEMFEYVQKRGFSTKKGLTDRAMDRFNISSPTHTYATSTTNYTNQNSEAIWGYDTNGHGNAIGITARFGIAPAIHLKPDYTLSNGKKARNLAIGELVTFGTYDGAKIQWRVINKTPEGFPLLWAEKSVTLKRYDAPGEIHLRNSVSVNFPNADISIRDDLKFTNGHSDITPPYLRVVDDSDLHKRQNGSFSMVIEAVDNESGIDTVILPNGNRVKTSKVTYTFTENKRYYFTAIDKAGNHYGFEIPVGNVNPPASVIITPSASGWTNKNVSVDIKTTQANTDWYVKGPLVTKPGLTGPSMPSFTTYAGKRYRLTGDVRLVSKKDDRFNAAIRMPYRQIASLGNNYRVSYTYPQAVSIPIKNLKTNEWTSFDETFTINGSYFDGLRTYLAITHGSIENGNYSVEWRDVEVVLLDKEDFRIDKIILPSGKEVAKDSYVDTLSKEGTYTYKVLDSRGKTTEKSVTVKIDKVKPVITATGDLSNKNLQQVTLKINASDDRSGVKRIRKPNGEWDDRSSFDYNIYENGSYIFTAEDHAGNQQSVTVSVKNLDNVAPTVSVSGNPTSWTNQNAALKIAASDSGSGVSTIELPDKRIVNGTAATYVVDRNGTYEFIVTDKAGNKTTKSVNVSFIDKEIPTGAVVGNPDNWTNRDAQLSVVAKDTGGSGIKQITKPDGTVTTSSSFTYVVSKNGTYSFIVEDNAGNKRQIVSKVTHIDKSLPSLTIEGNPNSWTNEDVTLKVSSSDGQSGIKRIRLPNGLWSNKDSELFVVVENGTYEFIAEDHAGNQRKTIVAVSKVDKSTPTIEVTQSNHTWTNQDVPLKVNVDGGLSGIQSITLPDGSRATQNPAIFAAERSGKYHFTVTNRAGTSNSYMYEVRNIDKESPSETHIEISKSE